MFDHAESPAQVEALVTRHVAEVAMCWACRKPLGPEPYRASGYKRFHNKPKCLPVNSAWQQKAIRAAKKAMKMQDREQWQFRKQNVSSAPRVVGRGA